MSKVINAIVIYIYIYIYIHNIIGGTYARSTKQLKQHSFDKQLLESVLLGGKLRIKFENFVVKPLNNRK